MYDPLAGRFTTADPVMQAPFWSQGLNRYAYVFNDPLNNTDPSGFITTGSTGGDIATGATFGAGWGAVGYGVVSELAIGAGSVIPGIGGALGNVGLDLLTGLGGGVKKGGGMFPAAAPTAAPVTSPNKINGPADPPSQTKPPGPKKALKERAPESYAAGPKNAGPDDRVYETMARRNGWLVCEGDGGPCHERLRLPPTSEMVDAVQRAVAAVWRWLRPAAPTVSRGRAQVLSETFGIGRAAAGDGATSVREAQTVLRELEAGTYKPRVI